MREFVAPATALTPHESEETRATAQQRTTVLRCSTPPLLPCVQSFPRHAASMAPHHTIRVEERRFFSRLFPLIGEPESTSYRLLSWRVFVDEQRPVFCAGRSSCIFEFENKAVLQRFFVTGGRSTRMPSGRVYSFCCDLFG
jgi:hypothetical protein